jgi:hypothetical protein
VLDLFCRPVLERYATTRHDKALGWCGIEAGELAGTPEDALAWAADSIRRKCPDQFLPEPPAIKQGIEQYLRFQAEDGEDFQADDTYPEWLQLGRTARLKKMRSRAQRKGSDGYG